MLYPTPTSNSSSYHFYRGHSVGVQARFDVYGIHSIPTSFYPTHRSDHYGNKSEPVWTVGNDNANHTIQANNVRRAAARPRTDENAVPTQSATLRNKSSISSFGPAQKVNANTTAPAKKPTATVKAGAKRTALGGVVANGQKDELMDDAKASGKSSPPPPDGL